MEEKTIKCNDGTTDVSNGDNLPCEGHGGVKPQEGIDLVQGLTNTQKWIGVIGLTALAYFLLYKSGALKSKV